MGRYVRPLSTERTPILIWIVATCRQSKNGGKATAVRSQNQQATEVFHRKNR
jgi:hypothetical protein